MNSQAMYSEIILDYYRHPKQKGRIACAPLYAKDVNPSCGDVIEFFAVEEGGKITDIRFDGKGCAISQAAASMLAEHLLGKPIQEVMNLQKDDILRMLGIPISGIRLKCALLGMKVIKLATVDHLDKGEAAPQQPEARTSTSSIPAEEVKKQIERKLRTVEDPELHMDIMTLGLIRAITLDGEKADIRMTLTSPMCPFGPQLVDSVKHTALTVDSVGEVDVNLEFDPPWEPPEDVKMILGV